MFYDPKVVSKFKDCGVSAARCAREVRRHRADLPRQGRQQREARGSSRPPRSADEDPPVRPLRSTPRKYIEDLANGEICLALGWSGDVLQATRPRRGGRQGHRRSSTTSRRKARSCSSTCFAIPADAKHPKNAHLFIDYLMRPDVAAKNSNYVNYANSNAASLPSSSRDQERPEHLPDGGVKAKLVPDLAESAEFTRLLTRTWTRFKTGK
jgi:putrescine transport system substrate-binding protein